mmetsp:Transcript_51361/g.159225  ORF Transcript_51361/g.159225 Transcript_51361/m.159225 type:complete len:286 (+) Transcript_51361:1279-2136(+)
MSIYAEDLQQLIRQHFNQILRMRRMVPPREVPRHAVQCHVRPESLEVIGDELLGVRFVMDSQLPCVVRLYWGASVSACQSLCRQFQSDDAGCSFGSRGRRPLAEACRLSALAPLLPQGPGPAGAVGRWRRGGCRRGARRGRRRLLGAAAPEPGRHRLASLAAAAAGGPGPRLQHAGGRAPGSEAAGVRPHSPVASAGSPRRAAARHRGHRAPQAARAGGGSGRSHSGHLGAVPAQRRRCGRPSGGGGAGRQRAEGRGRAAALPRGRRGGAARAGRLRLRGRRGRR